MNLGDLEITPPGVTRRAKVEHRETFVNLAIPIPPPPHIDETVFFLTFKLKSKESYYEENPHRFLHVPGLF